MLVKKLMHMLQGSREGESALKGRRGYSAVQAVQIVRRSGGGAKIMKSAARRGGGHGCGRVRTAGRRDDGNGKR